MKSRIFGIIFSIFGIFISFALLFLSLNYNKKTLLLSYKVNNNVDYKVYVNDSNFYDNDYITNERNIPVSYIDYINVDFTNNISFNEMTSLTYSYNVLARIEVTDSNKDTDNVVFSKDYELLNEKDLNLKNISSNNISKSIDIDYKKYNEVVNKYKLQLKMPVEAKLKVIMKVHNKNNMLDNNDELVLSIPLSVNTINIRKEYKDSYSESIYNEVEKGDIYIILSSILLVLSVLSLILIFKNAFYNGKNYMTYKLNKIMKYYEQIIVQVSNPPKIDKKSILKITEFKDMIDLNRELNEPILYYKGNDNYGLFIIINNNRTYIYEINSNKEKI